MKFDFAPLTIQHVQTIADWRYQGFEKSLFMGPYRTSHKETGRLVGPGGCEGFAALVEDKLAGLFEFYRSTEIMNIGLALRPDLTGKGWGTTFVEQGIDFGVKHYQYRKPLVELSVNHLNAAAVRVYEKVGFTVVERVDEEVRMRKSL